MTNTTLRSVARAPVRTSAVLSNYARRLTTGGVRAAAFWAAVLLPLAYLPVLHGLIVDANAELFLVLLLANIACVVIGHGHTPGKMHGRERGQQDSEHEQQNHQHGQPTESA